MFARRYFPKLIQPAELDLCLANGWYRLGQSIFTTHFIKFKEQYYSSIWLRVDLIAWECDKQIDKLNKVNKHFRVDIMPLKLDDQLKNLFLKYRSGIAFDASNSLDDLLKMDSPQHLFHSMQVCIYDHEKLIAAGIFDLGQQAAAGISSFYDHDYKKYSLGKFLIYQKMLYCKSIGMTHFYPGYVVPGYKAFDYKLSIGSKALAYFQLSSSSWLPIQSMNDNNPYEHLRHALQQLQMQLSYLGQNAQIIHYALFDAGLMIEFQSPTLFDYPIFLTCEANPLSLDRLRLTYYDLKTSSYHWVECELVWEVQMLVKNEEGYSKGVLQVTHEIFSSDSITEMALTILNAH